MPRPALVLALPPGIEQLVFDEPLRAELSRVAAPIGEGPLFPLVGAEADARLAGAEILYTGWGTPPVDAAVLARAPRLRLLVHGAGTVKDVVTPAVWQRGVRVVSAAAANAIPVAEFTLAAILLQEKRVLWLRDRYREARRAGHWGHRLPEIGNYGKRIGIVGASHIGRLVLGHLRRFDFTLGLTDPTVSAQEAAALGAEKRELTELLAESDVVSLHAPSLPETHRLLGAAELARMRDGALLVNTARGALVDHAALEAELVSGRLRAVIDVTEPEILPADSPLYELPNVLLTPHIAGSQGRETHRMTRLALAEIERFATGEALQHEVRETDLARIA